MEEVELTIKEMKNGKAIGVDGIPIELVKCLGEGKKEILSLCNRIYKMDGWMDGRMDGRTDGRTNGRTNGRTDGWMDGRTDGWMDGWMDGWIGRRMARIIHGNGVHCKDYPENDESTCTF